MFCSIRSYHEAENCAQIWRRPPRSRDGVMLATSPCMWRMNAQFNPHCGLGPRLVWDNCFCRVFRAQVGWSACSQRYQMSILCMLLQSQPPAQTTRQTDSAIAAKLQRMTVSRRQQRRTAPVLNADRECCSDWVVFGVTASLMGTALVDLPEPCQAVTHLPKHLHEAAEGLRQLAAAAEA